MRTSFITVIVSFLLTFSLVAQEKINVLASFSVLADMTQNIGGDLIEVNTLVPTGSDPHTHEPTPRDAKLVNNADLILLNGLTFEGWFNELIENSGTKATTFVVSTAIKPIESIAYKDSYDPHAWMNVQYGISYVEQIAKKLIELDPSNKKTYEFNLSVYKKQLAKLDSYVFEEISKIPKAQRILITSHDAFQYFGIRYGLRLEAVLGTSTDAEVQTQDLMRVSKLVRSENVPAVFIESTVNPKLLKQIASDNNVEIGGSLYADSLGDEHSPAPTYYDMIKYNTDVIVKAMTQKSKNVSSEVPIEKEESGPRVWFFIVLAIVTALILLLIKRRSANK